LVSHALQHPIRNRRPEIHTHICLLLLPTLLTHPGVLRLQPMTLNLKRLWSLCRAAHPRNLSAKDSKDTSSKSSKSSRVLVFCHNTNVQCKDCGKLGHTSLVCPELTQSKSPPDHIHAMAKIDNASKASDASSVIILAQAENLRDHQPINPDFVLLNIQSTVDLFSNLKHVQNICLAQLPIKVHCNKGTMSTVEVVDFCNTQVYVNKDDIGNALSLFRLGQKYWITYMTAMTRRVSFRFIPLEGSWNSIPHPMAFTLSILTKP
jgi:hypothetical protein